MTKVDTGKVLAALGKYKYLLLVAAAGVLLLLWPSGKESPVAPTGSETAQMDFDQDAFEAKLAGTLSAMNGVGRVEVMVTLKSGGTLRLQEDRRENQGRNYENGALARYDLETDIRTVMAGGSGGVEQPIILERVYPVFQGAFVVCDGADSAETRLRVVEAVAALTGLGADKITVTKMKS